MDMKRDYYEDVQLLHGGATKFWFCVLIACLVALPLTVPNYYLYMVNYMAINVLVAMGLNILVGYTGQISLGHAGFFAIGAYTTVLLFKSLGVPVLLSLAGGGFLAAGFGFLLGLPALRLEGPYLAIATLGFGMAIIQILGRWEVFGGRMGIEVPRMTFGSLVLNNDARIYAVVMTITVAMIIGARNLLKTRVGRAFIAIRDSDIAAETMGVNLTYYKTLAFAVSAFYAGVAGGLMAFVLGYINPSSFSFVLSILFLAMVVVGGVGSVLGSVMGGILISFLNLKLDAIQDFPVIGHIFTIISENWMTVSGLPNVASIIFGLILIAIIVFEPLGLYGIWIRTKLYWRTWPF